MKFIEKYFENSKDVINKIDLKKINKTINLISRIKKNEGRVFFLGIGGSAANCSHAVNDFRKLANIECYTPIDNVSELTARTNDDGFDTIFKNWLKISKLNKRDLIFIFSVGGGNKNKNVSTNLIDAIDYAKSVGAKSCSITADLNGYAVKKCDIPIIIPTVNRKLITPLAEAFQGIIWHLIVSHPKICKNKTKW